MHAYMYVMYWYCLINSLPQEECNKLVNATVDGDMEVVSTLINDGVDMNAIVHEVHTVYT